MLPPPQLLRRLSKLFSAWSLRLYFWRSRTSAPPWPPGAEGEQDTGLWSHPGQPLTPSSRYPSQQCCGKGTLFCALKAQGAQSWLGLQDGLGQNLAMVDLESLFLATP